jgi:hypothetical protein
MNVGDKISYHPVQLAPEDVEQSNLTVDMYEPAGVTFNQPMVSVKEIDHWIPARECRRMQ